MRLFGAKGKIQRLQYSYLALPPLDQIYIDKSVRNSFISNNIINRISQHKIYKDTRIVEIDDYKSLIHQIQNDLDHKFDRKSLLIYPEMGQFMHPCPGSDGVICCRYYVLDFGMNCPYDCQYCYLQTYAKIPILTIAGNIEELLIHLKEKIISFPDIHWRIGTGEYTDSLALDALTGIGKMLVEFFSNIPNATLELKTKSVEIESLLNLDHREKTVISWSLNPEYIVNHVEYYCSSLDQRFEAARRVIESGYQVAFHFDPVFYYEGWETDYLNLIDRLFAEIPRNKIRWISMGTFRYSPGLKEKLRLKYPDEFITRAEMILAPDNKYRYIAPIRTKIYRLLSESILKHDPEMMLYLCMETRANWKRVFQQNLAGPSFLDQAFEKRRKWILRQGSAFDKGQK